jgi:uncharacterized protein (TIGR02145 family)
MKTITIISILCCFFCVFPSVYSQSELEYYVNKYTHDIPEVRTINKIGSVYEANLQEAETMAYDLESISNFNIKTGDPSEILNAYKQKSEEINQYIIQKKQGLREEFAGAALGILDDLAISGSVDPLDATINILGSIGKQSDAKKAQSKAIAELDRKLQSHMLSAKNDILNSSNEYYNELLNSAANAFDFCEEEFYLDFMNHVDCYNKSIEANYNYMSSDWINNPCPQPQKSISIPNKVQSESEKIYHTAKRKQKLFREYNLDAFRHAALRYASTAISINPKYFEAYYLKAQLAINSAEKFNNLLIANYLHPSDVEVKNAKEESYRLFKEEFNNAIVVKNTAFLQYSIEHNLNGFIENDLKENLILLMVTNDNADGLQLLLNQETQENGNINIKERLRNLMAICCIKDAGDCIVRLYHLGVDPDWRNSAGMTPLKLAIKYKSIKAISKLIEAGADYETPLANCKSNNNREQLKLIYKALLWQGIENNKVNLIKQANDSNLLIELKGLPVKDFIEYAILKNDVFLLGKIVEEYGANSYFKNTENKGTLYDLRDGQTYDAVKIGEQWWMAENLNFYTENSWCYKNDEANCNKFGRLYEYEIAIDACPDGWRLPSNDDYRALINLTIERYTVPIITREHKTGTEWSSIGKGLRAKSGWEPNQAGYDIWGFKALPAMFKFPKKFQTDKYSFMFIAVFWCTKLPEKYYGGFSLNITGSKTKMSDCIYLVYLPKPIPPKGHAYSIRCIKD